MTTDSGEPGITTLSPDDAFGLLANQKRVDILQTLANAEGPLTFSTLYDRTDASDSGQFNYHLDQLVEHFVRKTDSGYTLSQTGRRVVEAVLSGVVTETPSLEPTEVDWPCPYCGSATKIVYNDEMPFPVEPYCTECAGLAESVSQFTDGQLGALRLPPAGIRDRTLEEVLNAAVTWTHLEILSAQIEVCPYCSSRVDRSVSVCETHDSTAGPCDSCSRGNAIQMHSKCTNCIFESGELFAAQALLPQTELLAFLTTRGFNPLTDSWGPIMADVDEEVLSSDPFEASFTFTFNGDTLTLVIDEDLSVVEATGPGAAETSN